jgi:ABC-type nitrate/sulfonate/bicarbonate transport system substrate-binding protein
MATSPSGQRRLKVGAGFHDWNHLLNLVIAKAKGYFADEGLEVERVVTGSDENTVERLANGDIDIAVDATAKLLLGAKSRGADLFIVGARRRNSGFAMFGAKGLKTVADLKGKVVSASHPGGESDTQMRVALREAGLHPDRDVRFRYYPEEKHANWEVVERLRSGEVHAVIFGPAKEMESLLVNDGHPILIDYRRQEPPRQDRLFAAAGKVVRDSQPELKSFLKAAIRSNKFFMDPKNQAEVWKIFQDEGFQDEKKDFDAIYEPIVAYRIQADAAVHPAGLELMITEEKQLGAIKADMTAADILRLEALQAAQQELAH